MPLTGVTHTHTHTHAHKYAPNWCYTHTHLHTHAHKCAPNWCYTHTHTHKLTKVRPSLDVPGLPASRHEPSLECVTPHNHTPAISISIHCYFPCLKHMQKGAAPHTQ